nr:MAG TPA: hypothetical protein [Caudoviricetes sp.]
MRLHSLTKSGFGSLFFLLISYHINIPQSIPIYISILST